MSHSFTTDAMQTLLVFPFQDPRWKDKFLIGSLVVFAGFAIPIIPLFFLYGYTVQIMRRIIVEGAEPFLPEWDDWGQMLVDGLRVLGAAFIYMLPVIGMMLVGYAVMFLTQILSVVFMVPVEEGGDPQSILFFLVSMGGMAVWVLILGVAMLAALAVSVVIPVAIGHLVATGEFAAAFRFKEWWPILRANASGYLLAYVIVMGVSMLVGILFQFLVFTVVFCCLYPFLMAPVSLYLMVVTAALFGQAYRDGVAAQPT